MVVDVRNGDAGRGPAEPHERRRLAGASGKQRALRRDAALGKTFAGDSEVALGLVAEGVVEVARPNDDPLARLRARHSAARLDGHDECVARDESVLGRKTRAVKPGLLRSREDSVHVVRPRLVLQREKRADDQRAAGQVVRRAHTDLVPGDLHRRKVEHRELSDLERSLGVDAAGVR